MPTDFKVEVLKGMAGIGERLARIEQKLENHLELEPTVRPCDAHEVRLRSLEQGASAGRASWRILMWGIGLACTGAGALIKAFWGA